MKSFTLLVTLVGMLALMFSSDSQAQTNFSGEYKVANRLHVKGPEYGNAVPTSIGINQSKEWLVITHGSMDSKGGETRNPVAFSNDGKAITDKNSTGARKVIRTVKWAADKKSFTTTSKIYREGSQDKIELTRIDEYKLSPDSKQLQFHRRSVETITESWEDRAVYGRR